MYLAELAIVSIQCMQKYLLSKVIVISCTPVNIIVYLFSVLFLPSILTLRVCFLTKIWDRIKNQDHHNFLLRKETLYSKNEYFSFISIETTHSLDGIVEKELHACRCCCKFADLSFYSRQLAQGHRLKMSLEIRYLLEK